MTKIAWEGPVVEERFTVTVQTGTSGQDSDAVEPEYDRFESLTKSLLKVPKSEIDAQRKKS